MYSIQNSKGSPALCGSFPGCPPVLQCNKKVLQVSLWVKGLLVNLKVLQALKIIWYLFGIAADGLKRQAQTEFTDC